MKQRLTLETLKHRQALIKGVMFFFVIVLVWIGFTIYRSQTQTTLPDDMNTLATPLNPNINMSVVDRIEQKRTVIDRVEVNPGAEGGGVKQQ